MRLKKYNWKFTLVRTEIYLIKTEDYSDKNKIYSEKSQTQIRTRFARLIMGKRIKIPERMPGKREL